MTSQPQPTAKFVKKLPPGISRRRTDWLPLGDQLRNRPGEWALISTSTKPSTQSAASLALAVRRGYYLAFRPAGHFEALSHGAEVYARYIGGAS